MIDLLAPERTSTLVGDVTMSAGTPRARDVIRACRAAARDHMARDPLSSPLPSIAYAFDDAGRIYESSALVDRVRARMHELRARREDRARGYGHTDALPWRACRVIGCMGADPVHGAGERYALIVRYGVRGALACYGVSDDRLSLYWD